MPSYTIQYETWNSYQNHVGESFFSFLIMPCEDEIQQVDKFKIENSIQENHFFTKNHFGFNQLMIHSLKQFNELRLKMECEVRVLKFNPYNFKTVNVEKERSMLNSVDFKIDHQQYLINNHYTSVPFDQLNDEWKFNEGESTLNFLLRLNDKIHNEFVFDPNDTSLHQNASLTLQIKKGVCQDFTHLFLGIARSNGMPSRYVSGYLNQGDEFVGSILMHAWVETYIPGAGWLGFDPTNNLMRDYHYIKVCHGVDYDDCSPIKGILKTEGDNKTHYEVSVIQQ